MAIIPKDRYPDQIDTSDATYPDGKAQNITVQNDDTGTPWERDILNDIFGFQQAILVEAGTPASGTPDRVGASQYLYGLRALLRLSRYSADVDAQTGTGTYYTDGTTTNRPRDQSGAFNTIAGATTGSGTQRYVTYGTNEFFYRARQAGAWGPWFVATAEQAASPAWPTLADDNLIPDGEVPTDTTADWVTGADASISVVAEGLQLAQPQPGDGSCTLALTDEPAGDWMFFATITASDQATIFRVDLMPFGAFGINADYGAGAAGALEQGRVTLNTLTGLPGSIRGPIVDTTRPIEVAFGYQAILESLTLYVKVGGQWVNYGASTIQQRTTARQLSLSIEDSFAAVGVTMRVSNIFRARPNAIAYGDEITAGSPDFYYNNSQGLTDNTDTWPRYADIFQGGVRNSIVVNRGLADANSTTLAAALSNVLDATSSARVVFLQASINDWADGVSMVQRTQNITAMAAAIVGSGAVCVLLNSVYPNADAGANFPAEADYMRNWWEGQSAGIGNVALRIDWMRDSGILDGDYMATKYTRPDGRFPNAAGYELLGKAVEALEP